MTQLQTSDVEFFWSLLRPTNDTDPAGGAIDPLVRVGYDQFSATDKVTLSGGVGDTRLVPVVGMRPNNTQFTESIQMNGVNKVPGAEDCRYLISVLAPTVSGTSVISVFQGLTGALRATIPINEKGFSAAFPGAISEAGAVTRYAKLCARLKPGAPGAALDPQIDPFADASAKLKWGLATGINDSTTIANRRTPPGSVVFTDLTVTLASGVDWTPGDYQAIWMQQSLDPANAAFWQPWVVQAIFGTGP